MVKNTNQGWHRWTPPERAIQNPLTSMWTTPNTSSGKFMQQPRPECCVAGEGCQSRRLRDRVQAWLDNTGFHHRWIANGPLYFLCPLCRSMRDEESEGLWTLLRRAVR